MDTVWVAFVLCMAFCFMLGRYTPALLRFGKVKFPFPKALLNALLEEDARRHPYGYWKWQSRRHEQATDDHKPADLHWQAGGLDPEQPEKPNAT